MAWNDHGVWKSLRGFDGSGVLEPGSCKEECAGISILPRRNCCRTLMNDFARDNELKTGGNRVGLWSLVKTSVLDQKRMCVRCTRSCPLWVKSRHVQCKRACPLYPRKRPK